MLPQVPRQGAAHLRHSLGSLIQNQLIQSLWLGIALRYVLDSLKKPPQSKMFRFGLYALEQFKQRLPSCRRYSSLIVLLFHFTC